MKIASAAIVLAVMVGWAFILFEPNNHPQIVEAVAGCYRTADSSSVFRIQREGWLVVDHDQTKVTGYEDKAGEALLPDAKVLMIDIGDKAKLVLDSGNPLLLRISADHRELTIPSETIAPVSFQRTPCGNNL
jgi:hypothetical protein